jgi:hypothetical protein
MINVMQSNQNINDTNICIIDNSIWEQLFNKIKNGNELESLLLFTNEISYKYNMDKKNIIKDFLNYIIRNKEYLNIPKYFNFVENIIHFEECNNNHYVIYSLIKLSILLKELF